jgi:hypothetical protein
MRRWHLAFALVTVMSGAVAAGVEPGGTVRGRVLDETGGVLPGRDCPPARLAIRADRVHQR